jgi:hypothetical protein
LVFHERTVNSKLSFEAASVELMKSASAERRLAKGPFDCATPKAALLGRKAAGAKAEAAVASAKTASEENFIVASVV